MLSAMGAQRRQTPARLLGNAALVYDGQELSFLTRFVLVLVGGIGVHAGANLTNDPQGVPPKSFKATVRVDLGGAQTPLPHSWKRIFGSGHAALGLREDYQLQLKQARDELGLEGVRAHGTFDDDMGPVVTAHRTYSKYTKHFAPQLDVQGLR